jgi:sugar-phosphatase
MTSREAPFVIPCKAVLFDCDGVLVDSKASGTSAWSRWAEAHRLDPAAVLEGVHGRRSLETVAMYLPESERAAGVAEIDGMEVDEAGSTAPLAGAPDLLASLPPNWAIVTSATRPLLLARVGAAGLPLPSVVVTSEDVSAGKPSPEGYLLAAERLGFSIANCVVVEDSLNGILAGQAAGAGHVLGLGYDALDSTADSVILDLRACTWTPAGLQIGPEFTLRPANT